MVVRVREPSDQTDCCYFPKCRLKPGRDATRDGYRWCLDVEPVYGSGETTVDIWVSPEVVLECIMDEEPILQDGDDVVE